MIDAFTPCLLCIFYLSSHLWDYILQVKGNQETLLEDIPLYFEKDIFQRKKKELEKKGHYSKEMDFDHGRREIREYYVENDIEWLGTILAGKV